MIPLSLAEEGRRVRIVKITGGKGFVSKLLNMGIIEGEVLKIIDNSRGPVLVSKGETRLALGKGISYKILVEYLD